MNKEPHYGNGKICYIEIPADDIAKSSLFYEAVFGWRLRRRDDGAIAFDDTVNEVSGSWVTERNAATNIGMLLYIMVDNIEDTIKLIIEKGGEIVQSVGMDPGEITARFTDPFGNIFGLYQEPS